MAKKQVAALFIHGIGTQGPDYANFATKHLGAELAKRDVELVPSVVHWAPAFDRVEDQLLKAIVARGADNSPLRRLAVNTLADALFYDREGLRGVYNLRNIVDRGVGHLYRIGAVTERAPLFVFAHSLGGLIFIDYLRSHEKGGAHWATKLRALFTFGCNIPLFRYGGAYMQVPKLVARRGSWTNLWDKDDCLGFPLQVMPELAHVEDVKVNVGGLLTWWNGFSHTEYWDDRSFWRKDVAPRVLAKLATQPNGLIAA